MYERRTSLLGVLVVAAIFLTLVVVFGVRQQVARRGSVPVEVVLFPRDAQLYANGKAMGSGTIFLKPGNYRFSASKQGWTVATEDTVVSASRSYVGLVLSPVSPEAKAWYDQHSSEAGKIGGLSASSRGEALAAANPIISKLPHYDVTGPFAIDYGFVSKTGDKIFLLIGDSSPQGRERALQWIRDQGFNPTTLDIRFTGFVNPTTGGAL